MGNKNDWFMTEIKKAVEDADNERFDKLLKERKDYIESLENVEEKERALLLFIESDKETARLIQEKKDGFKNILLTQNNQLKAVKKYEKY